MFKLDHLAVLCTNLAAGVAWVEAQLGVQMQTGGKHVRYGTHNMLLGLADGLYLEVIAKDPEAPTATRPTWFDLDHFSGIPRLSNWICQTPEFDKTVPIVALERGELRWEIAVPDDGTLVMQGAYPTLIRWGEGITHPADQLIDQEISLRQLEVICPVAPDITVDPRVIFTTGSPTRFRATFDTPNGLRVLG